MKDTIITQTAFDAFTKKEKLNHIDIMLISLGNPELIVKIGDMIFEDRESLFEWQIKMNLFS